MKNIILISIAVFIFASCRNNSEQQISRAQKLDKLNALKKQQGELNVAISTLEKDLGLVDKKIKNVQVGEVTSSGFNNFIEIQGAVVADKTSMISARGAGNVISVKVQQGDYVSNGQLLAVLDNAMVESGLKELESQLLFAENIFNKQKNLWDQKIGTEVQYLSAKNNVEALQKKIASVKIQGSMAYVRAPFSGIIEEVFAKPGQTLAPGIPAFKLTNLNALKVKADVAETYTEKLKNGTQVLIQFPDLNNKEIKTKINYTSKTVHPLNRTLSVEANIANINNEIKPNMVAVLKLSGYSNSKAISIPVNAVIIEEDKKFVFIAKKVNDKFIAQKSEVKVGQTYNSKTEIVSGLQNGDKVITFGYNELEDGEIVNIQASQL
jgi:membrane fusion protein (multidrug efflux system)